MSPGPLPSLCRSGDKVSHVPGPGSPNPDSGMSTNCTFGSCKKSLLWGNLVGQCFVDTEEEEDLELEEVRGDPGPSLPQSS